MKIAGMFWSPHLPTPPCTIPLIYIPENVNMKLHFSSYIITSAIKQWDKYISVHFESPGFASSKCIFDKRTARVSFAWTVQWSLISSAGEVRCEAFGKVLLDANVFSYSQPWWMRPLTIAKIIRARLMIQFDAISLHLLSVIFLVSHPLGKYLDGNLPQLILEICISFP